MRAVWLVLALAASPAAWAQEQMVDLARLCAEAPPSGQRFASAPAAAARFRCSADAQGALLACALTEAAPDTPAVRYFALQQICLDPRRDPARLTPDLNGRLWAEIDLRFSIACTRRRGAQMCNIGPPDEGAGE